MTKQEAAELLHYWQYGNDPTNFTSHIFTLRGKADPHNIARLTLGFPDEMAIYQEWYDAPSQDAFFEKYGLPDHTIKKETP